MSSDDSFVVFVDESGDHGLEKLDAAYPVFVLAFCVIAMRDYARSVQPAITEFKFRHFGHDQVILHERDIRKDLGDFAVLRDQTRKRFFLSELTRLVADAPMTVIASVIRKDALIQRYSSPNNPYQIALGFGLERVARLLQRNLNRSTSVILECRGKHEDDELELEFRRVCAGGNYRQEKLPLEPRFVPKSANVAGLQLADLIARPIGRHVLAPNQPNRAFEAIEPKLDRSPSGSVFGWGLKIFP